MINVLKGITTALDVMLLIIIFVFKKDTRDTASRLGFSLMELAYVLSIVGMWVC